MLRTTRTRSTGTTRTIPTPTAACPCGRKAASGGPTFRPPDDFDGWEAGEWGVDDDYFRDLTPAEALVLLADDTPAVEAARRHRDAYFGFAEEEEEASVQDADPAATPAPPPREDPGPAGTAMIALIAEKRSDVEIQGATFGGHEPGSPRQPSR